MQEAVLAREITVYCGDRSVTWFELADLAHALLRTTLYALADKALLPVLEVGRNGCQAINDINGMRNDCRKNGFVPFAPLLRIARSKSTKEPVDRCYGILGLCNEWFRERVSVDYSPEDRQKYWRLYLQIGKILLMDLYLDLFEMQTENNSVIYMERIR